MDFPFTSAIPRKCSVATREPGHVCRQESKFERRRLAIRAMMCAVADPETEVVNAMAPCDQELARLRYARPCPQPNRGCYRSAFGRHRPRATILRNDRHDGSTPPRRGRAAPLPDPNEPISTFFPGTRLRDPISRLYLQLRCPEYTQRPRPAEVIIQCLSHLPRRDYASLRSFCLQIPTCSIKQRVAHSSIYPALKPNTKTQSSPLPIPIIARREPFTIHSRKRSIRTQREGSVVQRTAPASIRTKTYAWAGVDRLVKQTRCPPAPAWSAAFAIVCPIHSPISPLGNQ